MVLEPFVLDSVEPVISGETEGEGLDVVLCHGLSATRKYVTHGSHALPRAGFRVHTFDARGHGKSGPAPEGEGYGYEYLVSDLDRVVLERTVSSRVVVGGHSMGCHTAAAWALGNPDRVAALILVGPVYMGEQGRGSEDRWDARAEALADGGPRAFAAEVANGFSDPEIAATVERLALERAGLHLNRSAVVEALREVPRSAPFTSLQALAGIEAPTLVIGSRDERDPGHPLSAAVAWSELIPGARLEVEAEGESPLAWQGGRLSRLIAEFLEASLPEVAGSEGGDGHD